MDGTVVLAAVLLLAAAGAAAVYVLFVLRRPVWAVLPAIAAVLALGIPVFGPPVAARPQGTELQDLGGVAAFKSRYDQARSLYGQPVGSCEVREQLLSCWTSYARMEAHPEAPSAYWQMQNGNLGLELMTSRGIAVEAKPVVVPVISSFLAAEAARGVDTLYWYGLPRTSPQRSEDQMQQYFDKTVLVWPARPLDGADDPAAVQRLPVGTLVWSIEHRGADPQQPDVWTPLRKMLVFGAAAALLVTGVPGLVPGLGRRRSFGYGDL